MIEIDRYVTEPEVVRTTNGFWGWSLEVRERIVRVLDRVGGG